MPFQPQINDRLIIDGTAYRIAEHPAAPGIPYGQEGRQATVFQLVAGNDCRALKVFKPRFRLPSLVSLADKLALYADLPGLKVCRRVVLNAQRHSDLLREHPDLTYAVLMPWIEGPTWMEVLLEKRAVDQSQILDLARTLTEILASMEERGLAHCDVSGPNVLLPTLAQSATTDIQSSIALVDVEQLYGPNLERPEVLPSGSPGYAHRTAPQGLWESRSDRFAGAVLVTEMLGWCDDCVRQVAWGESYFDPDEMQNDTERRRILHSILQERWGTTVADLFERAWHSETLADCATFGEWLVALPGQATAGPFSTVRSLIDMARQMEEGGDNTGALRVYGQAQKHVKAESSLAHELALIVRDIERKIKAEARLDRVASEVAELERTERWQEAAEAYRRLAEQTSSFQKRNKWETARRECEESHRLAVLFQDGLRASHEGKLAEAKELLKEVVRVRPEYGANGKQAVVLLAELEQQIADEVTAHVAAKARRTQLIALPRVLTLALASGLVLVLIAVSAWWTYRAVGLAQRTSTAATVQGAGAAVPPAAVTVVTTTPAPSTLTSPPQVAVPTSIPTVLSDQKNMIPISACNFIRGSIRSDILAIATQICPLYKRYNSEDWCSQAAFEDELARADVPKPTPNVNYMNSRNAYVKDFYIDQYEVTNAQYAEFVQAAQCCRPASSGTDRRYTYFGDLGRANYPVVYITWDDARKYCEWQGKRLPTDLEWEKAARGEDGRWWLWDDYWPKGINYRGPTQVAADEDKGIPGDNDLKPVGTSPGDVSPYGVSDMAGNVMEWVDAMYGPGQREIRGGSWNTGSYTLRGANRAGERPPKRALFDVGFRCASDVKP